MLRSKLPHVVVTEANLQYEGASLAGEPGMQARLSRADDRDPHRLPALDQGQPTLGGACTRSTTRALPLPWTWTVENAVMTHFVPVGGLAGTYGCAAAAAS